MIRVSEFAPLFCFARIASNGSNQETVFTGSFMCCMHLRIQYRLNEFKSGCALKIYFIANKQCIAY